VVNKIDRPDARADEVLDEVFDLFVALDAADEQLDFPVLYASGRTAMPAPIDARSGDLTPLFKVIVATCPRPASTPTATLRHARHPARPRQLPGPHPHRPHPAGGSRSTCRSRRSTSTASWSRPAAPPSLAFRGLERVPVDSARRRHRRHRRAEKATVANTICAPERDRPDAAQPIDPPTLAMRFAVNDSPLAGREGDKVRAA
jgi:GTP-binding protein